MAHIKSRKHQNHLALPYLASAAAATLFSVGQPAFAQAVLKEVEVHGNTPSDYKADALSSPKFTQPLVDTPQTVSIIKSEIMRQQGATTLTEALRNTPGASTYYLGENGSTSTGDAVYMRGFDTSGSIFVDGVRDLGAVSRDMFNIQQVEVIKGPASTDIGRTAPSGAINLVSKTPSLENAFSGSVGAGSADFKRATIDWNRALSDTSAFRLNLLADDSGVAGRDYVKSKRIGLAPSIAFGLNTPTRVILSYLHVDQDNTPDGGVPTIGLPGYRTPDATRGFLTNAARVDSSNFYGTSSDFQNVDVDMFTARVEHDISADLKLRNITRIGRTHNNYQLTSYMLSATTLSTPSAADPAGWSFTRGLPTNVNQTNKIIVNQTNLSARLEAGGMKHDLSGGVELMREEQDNLGYYAINTGGAGAFPAANLYNPNPNVTGFNRNLSGARSEGSTETLGLYLFDTARINDQWQITGGVRVDRYNTHFDATTLTNNVLVPSSQGVSDTIWSGKLGVVYKPASNGSVYALVATAAQPPGGANNQLSAAANNAANPKFDPQKARTYEVGTKWDLLDNRLGLAAALYRTDVSNDIEVDPTNPANYIQTGKKRVQGVELSAVGNITPNWALSAGYTVMDTSIRSGTTKTADGTDVLAYTPKSAFTMWTTYRLPFGLTVGGGARYAGKLHRGTDGAVGTPAFVNDYWVIDALASYKVSRNVDVQLNVFNLFDKNYVAAINKSGYRYTPGLDRSARVTVNFTF
ncbi:catecholate siderophore receptor Fiu [Xylophilus sp. GOD-11R]|uniref:catecholate siderophore receptor Fiu n=1 Tax=Xylophilus sp. GOD-11R TaxID=3089814 RepID=UPI00298C5369|nr:catecholate siderophore receptor Fiu [Xylophilus sp. GOD-11R]WPB57478.1 catecholate siderophore receptor Fiu [Xylophilus sp. GOD-11R]